MQGSALLVRRFWASLREAGFAATILQMSSPHPTLRDCSGVITAHSVSDLNARERPPSASFLGQSTRSRFRGHNLANEFPAPDAARLLGRNHGPQRYQSKKTFSGVGCCVVGYQSVNPYDGKILKTFKELTDNQLETALGNAATCFDNWRHTTFAGRAAVVTKAAAIMRARIDEFARPMTLEMGKLIDQARGEVVLSADIFDYYAKNAERFLAPQHLEPGWGEAEIESSPFGVMFGIQPWNFPYYQLARFAAPNLMAGNVVMVKHAGCVPQCAIAFEKLWLEAGAPVGAYTNLLISHDQVNRVIDDPRIKGVALTGSVEAGKSVAGRAGRNLKKSTMELGGSDAFIVLG